MTKIEWAEDVWNVITGCTPISEGCAKCYAKRMATRLRGRYGYPADDPFRVTFHPDRLEQPLKWRKPRRIFVCSMGDLFHNDVQFEQIDAVIRVIAKARQHTFMILTKRPGRMAEYFTDLSTVNGATRFEYPGGVLDMRYHSSAISFRCGQPLPNLYLGVTAENQQRADERIPLLLQIPAAVRFISVEPMLSSVDISHWLYMAGERIDQLNLVICGAETGPGARPMYLEWARDLRDQCKEANVPFFFKKAGPKGTPIPNDLMIREFPRRDER